MRAFFMAAMVAAFVTAPAFAQAPQAAPPAAMSAPPALEGIPLGEPIASIRDRLGDAVAILDLPPSQGQAIWRYIDVSGAFFIDVLLRENVAYSITVVARFPKSPYTAATGAAFGMTTDQLEAKLGAPAGTTTNADDGSVDLWYPLTDRRWIYEFHGGRLDFIQLLPPHGFAAALPPGPPVEIPDGSSFDRAIKVVQPQLVSMFWTNTYLAAHPCGKGGHWTKPANASDGNVSHGNAKYTIVHVSCSDGSGDRDFYFDVSYGFAATERDGSAHPSNGSAALKTVYIDASALQLPEQSPASTKSSNARDGTSFDDAIVVTATSDEAGTAEEYAYLRTHPCPDGRWVLVNQVLQHHEKVPYDILTVKCSTGSVTRVFYFDIRSSFGKFQPLAALACNRTVGTVVEVFVAVHTVVSGSP